MKLRLLIFSALIFAGFFSLDLNAQAVGSSNANAINPPSQQNSNNPHQGFLPGSIVIRVLNEARVPFNTPLQTLVVAYHTGNCKIKDLGITPVGDNLYEVRYGGGLIYISIDIDT